MDTETHVRLLGLKNMIKEVYMSALERKPQGEEKAERNEIVHTMAKFCNNIQTSLQQAYGNVTINVPEIPVELGEEEVSRNPHLMEQLTNAVVSNRRLFELGSLK